MSITDGQLAPALKGLTFRGDPVDLASFRGKKVWIGFYRWASCPLCNLRIQEVIERAQEFEDAGVQHVAIFQSPPETIARYVGAQEPPFPIIADPDLDLYATYGVQTSIAGLFYPRVFMRAIRSTLKGFFSLKIDGPIARVPADFLVDPEGLVWRAYYGKAVSDHIPFDVVSTFSTDLCLDMPEPAAS